MQKEKLKKMDALSSDSTGWEERKKTGAKSLSGSFKSLILLA
jgi:hypothetical protein